MIRTFLRFAIEKSALNHTLLVLIALLSIFAYQRIPKEIFPPIDLDKILIRGGYPGASAQSLEQMVVANLEAELRNLRDLEEIEAIIKHGRFTIVATIKEGADPLLVLSDVKDRIALVRKDLPPDMDEPVATVLKKAFPLVLVAIAADVNRTSLLEVAKRLKRDLGEIPDLSSIEIRGDQEPEVRIALDKRALEAYGLPLPAVREAIANIATIFPLGTIQERGHHLFLSTQNGKPTAQELAQTIVRIDGRSIPLGAIATITFGLSEPQTLSRFNGKPNISINITKTKEGNAIELVRQIRTLLQEYELRYPGFDFAIYTDTSVWIRNRLNTVTSNLFFGLILVFTALLLTVNWRIALVVAMGIPVSFMIGLISLDLLGYSLNMLSLFGALIALGMLVDEAIVVAENIYRHLEEGASPTQAAIEGAAQMFPAVLTATMTTIFAFVPLLILSGEMGAFIKILPIVISILLLSSLFEAFYFLPLHAKELLRVGRSFQEGRIWRSLAAGYGRLLALLLVSPRRNALLLVFLVVAGTLFLARKSHFELFPPFDTTQIYIAGSVGVHHTIEETQAMVAPLEAALLQAVHPDEVKSITTIVGMKMDGKNNADTAPYHFHIFINLHEPKPQNFVDRYITPFLALEYDGEDMIRSRSALQIAQELRRIIAPFRPRFEELNLIVPQAGIVKSDVEISLVYEDEERVRKAIGLLEEAMARIEGVYNISDDAKEGEEELKLRLNEYGERLGLSEGYLATYLQTLYLDAKVARMFKDGELVYIRLRRKDRDDLEALLDLRIDLPGGGDVVLRDVVEVEHIPHFRQIIRENGRKIRTVYASLEKGKITSHAFYRQIRPVLEAIEQMGIEVEIKGEERENRRLLQEILQAFTIAILLIFAALVWMFNSFLYALLVLAVIPLSLFGVFVGNWIMGLNLTMPGMLGLVGLAGVVVNDGLIMLDFIKGARRVEEVVERATLRLRPILLTSITTILGLSTLIFFASGQSLILQPMAVTLGFGIAWGTIVNLFLLPLLFFAFAPR
ncbi:MAG: AcrB/AcrD/AcrF family protein [Nitratiruptor sp.]|nr:AcrB/AcrD/AcrF family protein [Nitratiruptor sp.]NPA83286.1 efflux RND transporter permease subunit [Campylobacterota bacterium]